MEQEYPAAVKSGIEILPAEMEETDKNILAKKYANLPEISNPYDDESFRKRLADTLSNLAIKSNDTDPEHNFLIGLAYLDGIDVEVNRERALELITKAADAELPEAMEKLSDMYENGTGVPLNYNKATEWAEKLVNHFKNKYGESHPATLSHMNNLALLYEYIGKYNYALKTGEKIYQLSLDIFNDNSPELLTYLNNLSSYYSSLNNYCKAIELGEKVYTLRCKLLGDEHPDTLNSLGNLAYYYDLNGNYSKSLELTEKAYIINSKILGHDHISTIISLDNLASAESSIGNHTKAIEFGEKTY